MSDEMPKQTYTTEITLKVYDDKTGTFVEVRDDSDSLDLVEFYCPETGARFVLDTAQARRYAVAIVQVCDFIDARVASESKE